MSSKTDEDDMIGHNGGPAIGGIAGEALQQIIARIERLTEEKQAIQGDISDVFAQAKGQGFDGKVIRAILKERKARAKDAMGYEEELQLIDLYKHALGMI